MGLARLCLDQGKKAVILAHTKQLQAQYQQTFNELPTMMGRSNYHCLIQNCNADEAPCTIAGPKKCPAYMRCPYYSALRTTLKAPIALLNYAYWLPMANQAGLFSNLDLLICDEGHLLEDQLRNYVQVELNPLTFRWADRDLPKHRDWVGWREWALTMVDELQDLATGQVDFDDLTPADTRFIRASTRIYESACRLAKMDEDWLINQDFKRGAWNFRPVWVHEYAQDYIFRHAKRSLVMSATIFDPAILCELLGLKREEVGFTKIPSTFPAENRPIFVNPIARVKHDMDRSDVLAMVAAVDHVISRYPGKNGLIHTGNYKMAEALAQHSSYSSKILTHDTKSRTAVLNQFKSSRGKVLASPSMIEGVDLPGEECDYVVVMKLPFPNKGDEQVARRMKVDPTSPEGWTNKKGQDWYAYETLNKFVQAIGRPIRSEHDKAHIYVLDANATWFFAQKDTNIAWRLLPDYVKDAMTDSDHAQFVAEQITRNVLSGVYEAEPEYAFDPDDTEEW